jgi:trans-aconitate 2-methyltransferase
MAWDPAQYLKFAGPRLRPALDLLQRIEVERPETVYDLGAGAGNVTRLIAARWPEALVVGVDSSAEMLAKAAAENPAIEWRRADLGAWQPDRPADIVYSNAALQWLGDHQHLFPRIVAQLAPKGVLAVQMPRNFSAPSHVLIFETALDGPCRPVLEPLLNRSPVAAPDFFYDLLSPLVANLDIWETEYLQVLGGLNPVKEYTKGSWLSPLLAALVEPLRSEFEAAYAARVLAAYPPRSDGKTLFPFRRLFLIATAG